MSTNAALTHAVGRIIKEVRDELNTRIDETSGETFARGVIAEILRADLNSLKSISLSVQHKRSTFLHKSRPSKLLVKAVGDAE
ncbi:hypothetical protein [Pseudooceanicola sp. LIPI14-2-Ac024]|uniref:hypothetical protein n=1 Tax=Pseudooceanicola sp. LIPI14-2-Ac024 TaxID=3344875 RepID=UPI0035D0D2BA